MSFPTIVPDQDVQMDAQKQAQAGLAEFDSFVQSHPASGQSPELADFDHFVSGLSTDADQPSAPSSPLDLQTAQGSTPGIRPMPAPAALGDSTVTQPAGAASPTTPASAQSPTPSSDYTGAATAAAVDAGANPSVLAWARGHMGSAEYHNLCEQFVENAHGQSGQYASAVEAGDAAQAQGRLRTDFENAPAGATVYYGAHPENGGYGHAAIYGGNGTVLSGEQGERPLNGYFAAPVRGYTVDGDQPAPQTMVAPNTGETVEPVLSASAPEQAQPGTVDDFDAFVARLGGGQGPADTQPQNVVKEPVPAPAEQPNPLLEPLYAVVPGARPAKSLIEASQNAAAQAGVPPAPDLTGNQSLEDYASKVGEAAQHTNVVVPGMGLYNPAFSPPNPTPGEEAPPASALGESGSVREATAGPLTSATAGTPLGDAVAAFNQEPASTPIRDAVQEALKGAETQVSDRFAAINKVGPESETAVGTYAGRTDAAVQRATQDLKPVYDAVKDVPGGEEALNTYVGLQRYIEAAGVKGNPNRLSPAAASVADAQAKLADLEAQLGPANFAKVQAADGIRQGAMDALLQDKVNSGFLTQDTADYLTQTQPHYNPTALVDYLDQGSGTAGSKLSQRDNLLRALTEQGSASDQLPPMQSAIDAIMKGSTNIARNEVIKTIANEGGFTAQRAGAMLPKNAITYFDGGQRMMLKDLPSDVSRAMNALTTEQMQGWQQVAMFLNKSLRLGATTLNPAFLATNAARDWVSAYTREGISPLADLKRMLPTAATKALGEQYTAAGGGMGAEGGYFVRGNAGKSLAALEQQIKSDGGLVIRNMADLKKFAPWNIVRGVGEAIEMGPRLATFEKHLNAGETAAQSALAGRRVTVDFSRAGTALRSLNALVPFLNARTQGVLTAGRTLRDNPASRLRLAGILGAAGAAYAWNRQFPEYADVPDYIKQNYAVVMLPGSQKNPTGPGYSKNNYVAVPLGEWGAFAVPFEAALRAIDGKHPGVMDTVGQTVNAINPISGNSLDTATASLLPPFVKTPVELGMNKDFFRNQDIVPESEKRLLPEQQIGPQTSLAAQKLGDLAHVSPRQIDFAVREMTGGGGRLAMQAASTLMGQKAESPPVAGGLLSGVYKTFGGQVAQSEYDNRDSGLAKLQSDNRDLYRLFGASGHPLGGPDAPPPAHIAVDKVQIPLRPADQLRYAQDRDASLNKIMASHPQVMQMDEPRRQAALALALQQADEHAKLVVLKSIGGSEAKSRALAERAAPPKPYQQMDVSNLRFSAPAA